MQSVKKFNAAGANFSAHVDIIETLLEDMESRQAGLVSSSFMLTGDPGTGKTSFIHQFAELCGLNIITIEIPHIVEEHLVSIPFIVFDPITKTQKRGETRVEETSKDKFKVVMSSSNLYAKLQHLQKIPDDRLISHIKSAPANIKKIWEQLGGDDETIPDAIQEARNNFKVVLFLDEFFRRTSVRIRNILRGILNNKIGMHQMPNDTYVLYASNLSDTGDAIDEMPMNQEFRHINFANPDKDDWFTYLVSKYKEDHRGIKLKDDVIDKFYDAIQQEHLSFDDAESEVRNSPRRWEQLILYVNDAIPVKDQKEADALIANVRNNFKNYLTGKHSKLMDGIVSAVRELIKETSNIEVGSHGTPDHEWRDSLSHQIAMKMKLGDNRKYIPIISGAPGIGKTSHIFQVSEDLDLRLIDIDCSTLNAEDVIGMPLSNPGEEGEIETKFSKPILLQNIEKQIEAADRKYLEGKSAAFKKEYEARDWKYLIFFDELNRTSEKVFNALRRVVLEKTFSDSERLPEGSVVVAAINPTDTGASTLTNHMRDVVDVIDSKPSWTTLLNYLSSEKMQKKLSDKSSKDASTIAFSVVKAFGEKFRNKHGEVSKEQKPFNLDIEGNDIYMSPREYTDLYISIARGLDSVIKKNAKVLKSDDNDAIQEVVDKLKAKVVQRIFHTLDSVFSKHHVDVPEWKNTLAHWIKTTDEVDIGDSLTTKKATVAGLSSILEPYFGHNEKHLVNDYDFISYLDSTDTVRFKEDLVEFILSELDAEQKILDKMHQASGKTKVLNDKNEIEFIEDEATKLEHLIREVIHAMIQHQVSYDKREIIFDAFQDVLRQIADKSSEIDSDDILTAVSQVGRKVRTFLREMKKRD